MIFIYVIFSFDLSPEINQAKIFVYKPPDSQKFCFGCCAGNLPSLTLRDLSQNTFGRLHIKKADLRFKVGLLENRLTEDLINELNNFIFEKRIEHIMKLIKQRMKKCLKLISGKMEKLRIKSHYSG